MFGASSMADIFFGSGNFLVAKELGIPAFGIDLDERSCETAAHALESTTDGEVGSFQYPRVGRLQDQVTTAACAVAGWYRCTSERRRVWS